MNTKDRNILIIIIATFVAFYFLPSESTWFTSSILSAFSLLHEYAREHVLTCLVPALFIAGAIAVFLKKDSVLKYLGHKTKKIVSYSIASVSGILLAVCSCTILPLFAGIRKRGAGLGPAITFLFAGPAINIAAIFLTMSVLGIQIGIARIIASIVISILVGISMALFFKEQSNQKEISLGDDKNINVSQKSLISFFILLLSILIINGLQINSTIKYILIISVVLAIILLSIFKFDKTSRKERLLETWGFSKILLPLLFVGVFIAGFIMPILPESTIQAIVGNNSILGNIVAATFGAFMYFSTLTEIPIMQALIAKGMSMGPALALLLAGPSLSLPNMLVIRKVLGNKKTFVYMLLVIVYSSIAGLIFGGLFNF